jgi:pimeloyl-ACP methyl ester carboxylesterase
VQDLLELVTEFKNQGWQPRHIFLVGASEGALIAALAIEQHPTVFNGGMPVSGPVGDFRKQIDYFGDFRVVFDYLFPDVLKYPGGGKLPFVVPQAEATANWDAWYKPRIEAAVANPVNNHAVEQLLRVTHAPIDPGDPGTAVKTAVDILWYNFFASKDAQDKLGGQPFDNTKRWYSGSDNDWKLNFGVGHVQRIAATGNALKNINALYQTSGKLRRPLVTMHTTLDHVVPYWHEPLYRLKVLLKGSFLYHTNLPIMRYGHGTFKLPEVLAGFAVLVLKVTLADLILAENVLPDAGQRAEFLRLAQENGAHPKIKAVAVAVNK